MRIQVVYMCMQPVFLHATYESVNDKYLPALKKDNIFHGLGLKNVEEIVEKHNGDIKYCGIEGWFQVDIIM